LTGLTPAFVPTAKSLLSWIKQAAIDEGESAAGLRKDLEQEPVCLSWENQQQQEQVELWNGFTA